MQAEPAGLTRNIVHVPDMIIRSSAAIMNRDSLTGLMTRTVLLAGAARAGPDGAARTPPQPGPGGTARAVHPLSGLWDPVRPVFSQNITIDAHFPE